MSKKVVRPILPTAPFEYDSNYINQLARTLNSVIDELRDANVNFQGIGSSGAANVFQNGDMFIADGGFLKIKSTTDIFSGNVNATVSVGVVTIAVS
jgi:hypothetical protein|tara:strand:- start:488 stop:775 length:288 start_codon:yes stop_codon:yes gene_type:complete